MENAPCSGKAVHVSLFDCQRENHGGAKRSRQLQSLLEENCERVIVPATRMDLLSALRQAPRSIFATLPFIIRSGLRSLSFRGVLAALAYGAWLHAHVARSNPGVVHLEIGPEKPIIFARMLSFWGVPYMAYPHNVEFLVPAQATRLFRSAGLAFEAERAAYVDALSVQTISKFDRAIIRSLGVHPVECLSYVPSDSDKIMLDRVRCNRNSASRDFVLILGSAANPPTRLGILRLLEMIGRSQVPTRFVLAGYGTEALVDVAPEQVEVVGAISNAELERYLSDYCALLINQMPTSGLLTRLVEATYAEIPTYVLEGYYQAYELEASGVHVIDSIAELSGASA